MINPLFGRDPKEVAKEREEYIIRRSREIQLLEMSFQELIIINEVEVYDVIYEKILLSLGDKVEKLDVPRRPTKVGIYFHFYSELWKKLDRNPKPFLKDFTWEAEKLLNSIISQELRT